MNKRLAGAKELVRQLEKKMEEMPKEVRGGYLPTELGGRKLSSSEREAVNSLAIVAEEAGYAWVKHRKCFLNPKMAAWQLEYSHPEDFRIGDGEIERDRDWFPV